MSKFNVARILEREDFHNRYTNGQSIALHEFIYPVLQAYDSVVIKADVEMGGNDQIFNLLAGRDLMRAEGMEPQVALTVPLLVGTDGVKKMSKSYGNYIGLTDEPNDMFGKVMSIADEIVPMYYRLCSTLSIEEMDAIDEVFANGTPMPSQSLAHSGVNIADLPHGEGAGEKAMAAFDAQFKKGEMPDDVAEFPVSLAAPTDEGKAPPQLLRGRRDCQVHRRGPQAHRRRRREDRRLRLGPQELRNGDLEFFHSIMALQSGKLTC